MATASDRARVKHMSLKTTVSSLRQAIRRGLVSWHSWWQEAISLVLLFLTFEIAVLSIEQAHWITPQPSWTLTLFLAVAAGTWLAKSRLRQASRLALAVILGILVIIWQSSAIIIPPQHSQSTSLQLWWQSLSSNTADQSIVPFAVFITAVIWIAGYLSVWYFLRRGNAWVAVCLGAVITLVNLSNLPEREYKFFFFYIITAALLLGQIRWAGHFGWQKAKITPQIRRAGIYFAASLLILTIFTTSIAWYTPAIRVRSLETLVSSHMPQAKDINRLRANIFAAVPRKQAYLRSDEQDELSFAKSFDIGEAIQFTITPIRQVYWRVRAYDVYNSSEWINSRTTEQAQKKTDRSADVSNQFIYTVTPDLKTDIILVAGEFVSSDTLEVSRIQVAGEDTVSVVTRQTLRPSESYTVTTRVSSPAPAELAQAGDSYPQWVTGYYLQLPSALPERIRQLSLKTTEKAGTPYEKALALNSYLSHLTYNQEIKPPPKGVDAVDHFLFTLKSGNCGYFASAMVVLLRCAGVPARLATGYLPGEEDETSGSSIIRARQFHAWPEAYFPGSGWIEVEKMPVPAASSAGDTGGLSDYVGYAAEPWDIGGGGAPSTSGTEFKPAYIIFPDWFYPALFSVIALAIIFGAVIWIMRTTFDRWLWGKGPGSITEIYARICYLASLAGISPLPQQTPLEYCRRLINAFPHQTKSLNYIVQLYLENRFGGRKTPELDKDVLLLKSRTDIYLYLVQKIGIIKFLFRKR